MKTETIRVLAIDDNPDNLTVLKAVMADALPGATVLTALNGPQGIEMAVAHDPDVILLDIVMPGMDGFEVCRRLKNDERVKHIPVVFLTALKTDRDSRVRAVETGAEAFLTKPLDETELIAQVRAMARIKAANIRQRQEQEHLARLVAERTQALEQELVARHMAEAALRASEQQYRAVVERAGEAIFIAQDGRLQFVNPRTEEIIGYTRAQLTARPFVEFIHPDDRTFVLERHTQRLQGVSLPPTYTFRIVTAAGETRWVELNATPTEWAGKPATLNLLTDISERLRAEDEIRRARNLFFALFHVSAMATSLTRLSDLTLFDVNQTFADIIGRPREQLLGRPTTDFNIWADPDVRRHIISTAVAEGHVREFELQFIAADGQTGTGLGYFEVLEIDGEKYILSQVLDITERKRAEAHREAALQALRSSEERMRAITESAQDAIIMMDPHGAITFWNPAAEAIFDYSQAEALGRNLHELLVPERYRAAHLAAFPEFARTGRGNAIGKTHELAGRRKDGQEIAVAMSLSAISLQGQWHAVGIVRDVTEGKQAEERLRAALAEAERLNAYLEEETARANDMAARAELASVAKSEFLANMSHEIRTPMNGVIGMTGLLLDTDLNAEQRRYAEIVSASGESLLALINDILDFSKIEAKKLDLEVLDFDLLSLLDDFAATLAVRAAEKGLELLCSAEPGVPALLRGDPGRLRQVLVNLAGNAIKFTHRGEVAVHASLLSETEAEVVLRFSVHDTGIGIPADKIGLLFQSFTQVDASTTRQYGGSGLGLAISKQLAALMGGEIGVESVAGQGSEFWFTARLARQPGHRPADLSPLADLAGVRVLVVDDNATGREILTTRLAAWGMRPAEAPDGPAALKALHRAHADGNPFRVAVLDMHMPGLDGETLGRTIKADANLANTCLVMLTSLGVRGEARRYEEIGFAAYLAKPVRHPDLFNVLSAALAASAAPHPVARPIVTRHSARELRRLVVAPGTRILLAEDNITNQQVALGILKNLGLHADAVAGGAEAVKALASIPYDLVLMDVQMPVLDGLEATRQIRQMETTRPIPIIAMTAHAMQGDRQRCLDAGMNDYIAKPVLPHSLAEVLERWLPRPAAEPPAQADPPAGEPAVPVFDRAALLERLSGDEEFVRELIAVFLDDVPRQIEALREYLDAGDIAGVKRQAHTIKGAAANLSGEALRAAAIELEMAGRTGDLAAVRAGLPDLEREFARLREAMQAADH